MKTREQLVFNPKVDYHRNGVSGEGFHTILFDMPVKDTDEKIEMIGFVFTEENEGKGYTAQCYGVLAVNRLAEGNARFFDNSWRGDHFIVELLDAINAWEKSGRPRYARPAKREVLTGNVKKLRVKKISAVLYSTPMHGFQGTVIVSRPAIPGGRSGFYGMDRHLTQATVNRLFGLIKVAKSFKVYPNHGEGVICLEIEA